MNEFDAPLIEAKRFLEDILAAMQVSAEVKESMEGTSEIRLQVYGENLGLLIGKGGEILSSLSLIVHTAVNKNKDPKIPVYVDVQDYRRRKEEKLVEIAKNIGDKVAHTGRDFTMDAMAPRERRIVHVALKDDKRVITESVGEGANRRVVIKAR